MCNYKEGKVNTLVRNVRINRSMLGTYDNSTLMGVVVVAVVVMATFTMGKKVITEAILQSSREVH